MTEVSVGYPVVYRSGSGGSDVAGIVTKVIPADPNIRDDVDRVDLVVFPPDAFLPQKRTAVEYDNGRNKYRTWRNIGDEWNDVPAESPTPSNAPALTEGVTETVTVPPEGVTVAVPGVQVNEGSSV